MRTVNVLVMVGGVPEGLISFEDTPMGNEKAEVLFRKRARVNWDRSRGDYLDRHDGDEKAARRCFNKEIEAGIEDGSWSGAGNLELFLIHSQEKFD
jgi:hypothetical protein